MDEIDREIIDLLTKNSRITLSDIGKVVHLSLPAVKDRLNKLEAEKIIQKYTVKLNRDKLGLSLLAFIFVNIGSDKVERFKAAIREHPAILESHHVAGEYDYLLKGAFRGTSGLEEFITVFLKGTLGVEKTNTSIVLSTAKEEGL